METETGDIVDIYKDIYKEIARLINIETAIKMHDEFKGQQIIFPKKLYTKEYIYTYVKDNYNGHNVRELSQKFEYSDRRIRQILREVYRD